MPVRPAGCTGLGGPLGHGGGRDGQGQAEEGEAHTCAETHRELLSQDPPRRPGGHRDGERRGSVSPGSDPTGDPRPVRPPTRPIHRRRATDILCKIAPIVAIRGKIRAELAGTAVASRAPTRQAGTSARGSVVSRRVFEHASLPRRAVVHPGRARVEPEAGHRLDRGGARRLPAAGRDPDARGAGRRCDLPPRRGRRALGRRAGGHPRRRRRRQRDELRVRPGLRPGHPDRRGPDRLPGRGRRPSRPGTPHDQPDAGPGRRGRRPPPRAVRRLRGDRQGRPGGPVPPAGSPAPAPAPDRHRRAQVLDEVRAPTFSPGEGGRTAG